MELTHAEISRYSRHLLMPHVGMEGQRKLKAASMLLIGTGGLGETVAMLLARADVGALVLAHDGEVEPENLNRIHLAFYEDLHQPRIEVFCRTLRQINPELRLVAEPENIHSGNVARLMEQADVVVDGAPLFTERYAMNQEAVRQRKPLIMAAPVDAIEVPAQGDLTLKPGGFHVMLVSLTRDLNTGDTIDLKLRFAQAGLVTVRTEVRAK